MMIYNKGATRTVPGAFCFFSKAVLSTITTAYVVGKTPFMSGTRVLAVRVATTAIHEGRFAMPVTKPCLVCGKPVTVKPSHAAKGAGKFCSRACMGAWKTKIALGYDPAKRVVKFCQVCKKELHIKQSHVDIEGTYCSRECMAQGYRTSLKGEANPNFKHGKAYTPEWRKAWAKRWRANHKEYISVWNRRIKAARTRAIGTHTAGDIKDQYTRQKGKCFWCGEIVGKNYHVDHVVPLARGGSNWPDNLVISCPTCNMRRRDKLPHEWAEGGRLL